MLSPLNPHPYIYKSSYDFNFQSVKNKVQDYIRHADEKIQKDNINTHEKDGGVTTVVLCKQDPPHNWDCLLYTSPSPRDRTRSRMPSSA